MQLAGTFYPLGFFPLPNMLYVIENVLMCDASLNNEPVKCTILLVFANSVSSKVRDTILT